MEFGPGNHAKICIRLCLIVDSLGPALPGAPNSTQFGYACRKLWHVKVGHSVLCWPCSHIFTRAPNAVVVGLLGSSCCILSKFIRSTW